MTPPSCADAWTREGRFVPQAGDGQSVGPASVQAEIFVRLDELRRRTTPIPAHFDWDWVFRAVPRDGDPSLAAPGRVRQWGPSSGADTPPKGPRMPNLPSGSRGAILLLRGVPTVSPLCSSASQLRSALGIVCVFTGDVYPHRHRKAQRRQPPSPIRRRPRSHSRDAADPAVNGGGIMRQLGVNLQSRLTSSWTPREASSSAMSLRSWSLRKAHTVSSRWRSMSARVSWKSP